MQGQDFHVPGQTFSAQPGGQVGGGGAIGVPGGRGALLGRLQSIAQGVSGLPAQVSSPGQNITSAYVKSQPSHTSSSLGLHNQPLQEMGKQTLPQNQPTPMQQVYLQNASRPMSQQNYYSSGQRPQQSRSLNPRGGQPGNPNQVVGIPAVGAASAQPAAMYPHPNIAMSASSMYVQNPVTGIHANPHQQTVYSMNSQMPLQYSGPPQRHQTHQGQFQYQTYQPVLSTSNLYGYTHGTQHPGFFYHQPPNAALTLNRSGTSSVGGNNQHLPGSITGPQSSPIVPQGSIQQPSPQQQNLHPLTVSLPQTEVYPNFSSNVSNTSSRTKKPRTKAIIDIVNPNTGKNISAEIYKDEASSLGDGSNTREDSQSSDCKAEIVVADFAARVAKLASEPALTSSCTEGDAVPSSRDTEGWCLNDQIHEQVPDIESSTNSGPSAALEGRDAQKGAVLNQERDVPVMVRIQSEDPDGRRLPYSIPIDAHDIHHHQQVLLLGAHDYVSSNQTPSNDQKSTSSSSTKDCYSEQHPEQPIQQGHEDGPGACFDLHDVPDDSQESCQTTNEFESTESCQTTNEFFELNTKGTDSKEDFNGKTMQKQKHKTKVKGRDVNRRNLVKNENDVNTATNPIPMDSTSAEAINVTDVPCSTATSRDQSVDILMDGKKDDHVLRDERSNQSADSQSLVKGDITDSHNFIDIGSVEEVEHRDEQIVTGDPKHANTADVVDHITVSDTKIDRDVLSSIVVQKNEENARISGGFVTSKELQDPIKSSPPVISSSVLKEGPLKYTYTDDQWSPVNTTGKKVYGREFLMKLQNDPKSRLKPSSLPDLDVVLKDITKTRGSIDHRFKDTNLGRHDSLFPGFAKSTLNAKVLPPNKKSHSGKPKPSKPIVIQYSLSLREEVKLRESDNAWRPPSRTVQGSVSEEEVKSEQLYKKVRSVLNKLTPQKFNTLVNQVRDLKIDTQERLQGVIDLVFEKAVDEPNFSVAYALMCKELSNIHVTGADSEDSSSANFRKLILTRCQTQFEKNTVDENVRNEKLREIESCTDPEKKKEFQINFDEEERRIRIRSVGNIRFIGELFKQNMLRDQIMHQCIRHLLSQVDEENLECLCKLLTTIGKVLETKNVDLSDYFKQMQQIANRKGKISSRIRFMLQDVIDLKANNWVPRRDDSNPKTMDQIQREAESERLDIQLGNISLHTPRKDERVGERKRNRGGGSSTGGNSGSMEDGGWSQPVGRTRQVYSVETAKLKNKPPSMDDMQLGSRSTYQWAKPSPKMTTPNKFSYLENINPEADKRGLNIHLSGSRSTGPRDYGRMDYKTTHDDKSSRNGSYQVSSGSYRRDTPSGETLRSQNPSAAASSSKPVSQSTTDAQLPQLSREELHKAIDGFFNDYILEDGKIEEAANAFRSTFPKSSHVEFVQEILNSVIEKLDYHRQKTSSLLATLLSEQCIDSRAYGNGLGEILKTAKDLIIDIPKLWTYLAKILVQPICNDVYPMSEFRTMMQSFPSTLRNDGHAIILMAELLTELKELKGSGWTSERWNLSGLTFSDFLEDNSRVDEIVEKYNLGFISSQCPPLSMDVMKSSSDMGKIREDLVKLLKKSDFDEICSWIQLNVSEIVKEPQFIRTLMTAILETSIEQVNDKWTFKVENFDKLQKLIQRFVDADERLELQCLFAVQAYITKLSHPAGLLVKIMNHLCEFHILSNEAFLAWEKDNDPAERSGKSVALLSLKSFFIPLKEGEDISDTDEPIV